ncbi:MAG: hypothetical protein MUE40_19005 [Anaerolineae bacterium]|nr:hypothetical protein [Anaerolineae bacterium]
MEGLVQVVALLVILAVFMLNSIVNALTRRRDLVQRRLPALERLPDLTAVSIEASRPLHFSAGSAAPGTESTLLALAGAEITYYVARQVTLSDAPPLLTVTESVALPLATDTLRLAYASRGRLERFKPVNVRWYPAGERALAFAGGLSALQSEEKPAANLLTGSFGTELALILDSAQRQGSTTLSVSDRLEGQAVAWAMADQPLIGEEVFAAAGYLSEQPRLARRNAVLDAGRWLLVAALLSLAAVQLLNSLTGA